MEPLNERNQRIPSSSLRSSQCIKPILTLLLRSQFACVADAGWITGHTYIVYGPLSNGVTTFMFESTPMYPDVGRYWDMVQRHKFTQFYTAPTAIRSLMRFGDDEPNRYDLSSLRVLGTVGEPINPEAWRWYYEVIGKEKVRDMCEDRSDEDVELKRQDTNNVLY